MGLLDRIKGAAESVQAQTSNVGVGASAGQMALANRAQKLTKVGIDTPAHIVYPSNPFFEGDDVTVKVEPDDRNVMMIFGHA